MGSLTTPSEECRVCGDTRFVVFDAYRRFRRVTSDCRAFRSGGELRLCRACGTVQKKVTEQWLAEIVEIYRDYAAYYQSEGEEQAVFDPRTHCMRPRSEIVLERLIESVALEGGSAALDIGCGTGVTLKALSRFFPTCRLYGHDLDRRNEERLRSIPNFEQLYTCNLEDIPECFDLVILSHVLEHFPEPLEILRVLLGKLRKKARLLIQVCDVERNPFDLLVADHLMHFSAKSLRRIVETAGYHVELLATDWVAKELTCVARIEGTPAAADKSDLDATDAASRVSEALDWLQRFLRAAEEAAECNRSMGIFGTSVAATWLASSLSGRYDFFVDEDPGRIGRLHLGKPILPPNKVPAGSSVFLALALEVAHAVAQRLRGARFRLVEPPPFND